MSALRPSSSPLVIPMSLVHHHMMLNLLVSISSLVGHNGISSDN